MLILLPTTPILRPDFKALRAVDAESVAMPEARGTSEPPVEELMLIMLPPITFEPSAAPPEEPLDAQSLCLGEG